MFKILELIKAAGGKLGKAGENHSVTGVSIDSRTVKAGELFVAIAGDNFDGHDFVREVSRKKAACVMVRRGFKARVERGTAVIEVDDTVRALGDIARFNRKRYDIPVIAVTGSNGKTTTKDMTAWILGAEYKVLKNEGTKNNHIGVPMTLLKLDSEFGCAVIELGTNHFGEIEYLAGICEPTIAVITNIGPSHLEHFKDLRGVFKEKFSVMKHCKRPAVGLINADDPLLSSKLSLSGKKQFLAGFGISSPCDFRPVGIADRRGGFCIDMGRGAKLYMRSPGRQNIYNALAAVSVCRILGLDYKTIAGRLKNFVLPVGRLTVKKVRDITFIDDTYNANPASMSQAMDVLRFSKTRGRKVMVMGDMLELGINSERFHKDAGSAAARSCDIFITVGRRAAYAARAAVDTGLSSDSVFTCDSAEQARGLLFGAVAVGSDDIILLKGSRGMKLERILAGNT